MLYKYILIRTLEGEYRDREDDASVNCVVQESGDFGPFKLTVTWADSK